MHTETLAISAAFDLVHPPDQSDEEMARFNVHDAKTHLSKLVERAHAGEEIIITKNGIPYARLVPLDAPRQRQPGSLKGLLKVGPEFFDELPADELEAWDQ